jgi:hypothetical protein
MGKIDEERGKEEAKPCIYLFRATLLTSSGHVMRTGVNLFLARAVEGITAVKQPQGRRTEAAVLSFGEP